MVENLLNLWATRPWGMQLLMKQETWHFSQPFKHSQTLTTRFVGFFAVVNNWWIRALQIRYSCQSLPVVTVVAGPKHVCTGIIIWLFRLGTLQKFGHVQNITRTDFIPLGLSSYFIVIFFSPKMFFVFFPVLLSFSSWLEAFGLIQQEWVEHVFKDAEHPMCLRSCRCLENMMP